MVIMDDADASGAEADWISCTGSLTGNRPRRQGGGGRTGAREPERQRQRWPHSLAGGGELSRFRAQLVLVGLVLCMNAVMVPTAV